MQADRQTDIHTYHNTPHLPWLSNYCIDSNQMLLNDYDKQLHIVSCRAVCYLRWPCSWMFPTCGLWLDCPSLTALRYVMYFRFVDDVMFSHNGLYGALCVWHAYNSTKVPPRTKVTTQNTNMKSYLASQTQPSACWSDDRKCPTDWQYVADICYAIFLLPQIQRTRKRINDKSLDECLPVRPPLPVAVRPCWPVGLTSSMHGASC